MKMGTVVSVECAWALGSERPGYTVDSAEELYGFPVAAITN